MHEPSGSHLGRQLLEGTFVAALFDLTCSPVGCNDMSIAVWYTISLSALVKSLSHQVFQVPDIYNSESVDEQRSVDQQRRVDDRLWRSIQVKI